MPDFVAGTRTPPSMIAGIRGPEQLNQSRVVVDMQDEILLYMPSAAPLTVLTGKLRKKRQAHNYKFEFLEKDEAPRQLVLSADSLVSDTTLDVNTGQGARVAKYDMLLNLRTREISIATATPAADQITVVRAIGGGEADMLTGDSLVKIGNSYPDGSDIGDLKSVQEANLFNYCQILRKPFGFTGRDIVTELYGGSDRMNETKWMSIEHLKDRASGGTIAGGRSPPGARSPGSSTPTATCGAASSRWRRMLPAPRSRRRSVPRWSGRSRAASAPATSTRTWGRST